MAWVSFSFRYFSKKETHTADIINTIKDPERYNHDTLTTFIALNWDKIKRPNKTKPTKQILDKITEIIFPLANGNKRNNPAIALKHSLAIIKIIKLAIDLKSEV